MIRIIAGLFLSGLLFGSGPCLASCGPMLVFYLAGTKKNIAASLGAYSLFSLVRISVYLFLSLLIFFLGRFTLEKFLGSFSKYIFIFGGGFIILCGVLMLIGKRLEFKSWQFLERNILERDKKSIAILALVMGFLPCAPLLAILSYIGLISSSWSKSLLYSFSFGLGTFLSPLLLLSLLAGLIPHWLKERRALYYRIFSSLCGLMIIFLGIDLIRKGF